MSNAIHIGQNPRTFYIDPKISEHKITSGNVDEWIEVLSINGSGYFFQITIYYGINNVIPVGLVPARIQIDDGDTYEPPELVDTRTSKTIFAQAKNVFGPIRFEKSLKVDFKRTAANRHVYGSILYGLDRFD